MKNGRPSERPLDLESLGDEAVQQVSGALDGNTRLLLQRDGKVVGAIVTKEDLQTLWRAEKLRRERLEPFVRIGRKLADVPTDELEREIRKAVIEVRTEMHGQPYRPEWD